jgi:hypothetical protein
LLRIPVFIAAVVGLAVTLVGRVVSGTWPFELISNFPVQLLIAGTVTLLVAVLVRARLGLVVAVAWVLLTGLTVTNTLGTDPRPALAGAERITLGHLNAQTRHIDVAALGGYLMTTRPTVFVVLDPKQGDVPRLTSAAPGYRVHLTGSHQTDHPQFVRTIVLSRAPVENVHHPADSRFGASAVELTITGRAPVSVVVFGTESPTTPGRTQQRDRALVAAARWSRSRPARRVVMGDFNTTPWSPPFRRLLHDGRLFSSLDGFGLQVSWPESNVLLRIPIDHALLGPGLAATDRGTGPAFGSQHRSLHLTVASAR